MLMLVTAQRIFLTVMLRKRIKLRPRRATQSFEQHVQEVKYHRNSLARPIVRAMSKRSADGPAGATEYWIG